MKLTNLHTNIMGTISFNAKFKGMRKEQDFIVYPNPENGIIRIQSDTRCGVIVKGEVRVAVCSMFLQLWAMPQQLDTVENFEELLTAIRGTAGDMVGTSGIIYCDNSEAGKV